MERTTIMLPESLRKRAGDKAHELNLSLGEFLRTAAEDFLDREARRWTNDPLVKGDYLIPDPAPSYVSENVDRYLYGKKE